MNADIPKGWVKVFEGNVKNGDKIRSENSFVNAGNLGYASVVTNEAASAIGHPIVLYECVIRNKEGNQDEKK